MSEQASIEFQRLASAISLMEIDNHRLLISSSNTNEGKTSITLGLGLALTAMGFRILLVDGDFHKASLSKRLGYQEPAMGLDKWMAPVSIRPRLDLLPALSSQDTTTMFEWIAQGHFDRALTDIQNAYDYDYVLVDSAPTHLTSETALMAATIANVLLVVRFGISNLYKVHETLAQFHRHNAQVIGLTLNQTGDVPEAYSYSPGKLVGSGKLAVR
jgi:Mrp family chromosome partitioning ATPase